MRLQEVTNEYRELGRKAGIAKVALHYFPDWPLAWDQLSSFCHREARLMQQIDYLACTKASQWLGTDSILTDLFDTWKQMRRAA